MVQSPARLNDNTTLYAHLRCWHFQGNCAFATSQDPLLKRLAGPPVHERQTVRFGVEGDVGGESREWESTVIAAHVPFQRQSNVRNEMTINVNVTNSESPLPVFRCGLLLG
jgi:hypothetical protein